MPLLKKSAMLSTTVPIWKALSSGIILIVSGRYRIGKCLYRRLATLPSDIFLTSQQKLPSRNALSIGNITLNS